MQRSVYGLRRGPRGESNLQTSERSQIIHEYGRLPRRICTFQSNRPSCLTSGCMYPYMVPGLPLPGLLLLLVPRRTDAPRIADRDTQTGNSPRLDIVFTRRFGPPPNSREVTCSACEPNPAISAFCCFRRYVRNSIGISEDARWCRNARHMPGRGSTARASNNGFGLLPSHARGYTLLYNAGHPPPLKFLAWVFLRRAARVNAHTEHRHGNSHLLGCHGRGHTALHLSPLPCVCVCLSVPAVEL